MKNFKNYILIALFACGFVGQAQAGWIGQAHIRDVVSFADGYVHLAINNPPQDITCNYWGYQFRFDGTTPGGTKMYQSLMMAHTLNRSVSLGFSNSPVPGTDKDSGCALSTMSIIWNVIY